MSLVIQRLAVPLMLISACMTAGAADFPNKPVRFVVPYTAGGSLDVIARLIAQKLQESWRQPVVVENRAGAGGIIGVDYVAKSAPDGHTFFLNASMALIAPQLQKTPYDFLRDFVGVVQVVETRYILTVSPKTGVSTIQQLVEMAKTNPNRVTFGSSGVGTASHMWVELVKSAAKIDLMHVPYKGETAAMPDLFAGRIDLWFGTPNAVINYAKDAKLRPLLVTGVQPFKSLPDVPLMGKVYPGFNMDAWIGVFAPSATPKAIVDRIAADIRTTVISSDVSNRLDELGFEPTGVISDPFNAIIRREYERWGKIIRDNNIRVD